MWIFYVIFSFMCHFINQVWIIAYLADWDKELGLCSFHLVEVKITFGHLWSPWTLCIREVLGKKRTKWNMSPSHQNHEFLIFLSPKVYKSQNYSRAFLGTDNWSLILLKFPKSMEIFQHSFDFFMFSGHLQKMPMSLFCRRRHNLETASW